MKTQKRHAGVQRRGSRRDALQFAGQRFSESSADVILRVAEERGQYPYTLILNVIEAWAQRQRRKRERERAQGSKRR